jgi:TDG/mug DNA glycosylase family protein
MRRIQGFPPVIGPKPKLLILGTMPGKTSLAKGEYYGYERNQFWKLVYAVFGRQPAGDYAEKTAFLKSRGIALWDVLGECSREGSSADAAIRDEAPNDIPGLLQRYPSIRAVVFDGKKAQEFFRKHFPGPFRQRMCALPSTSPANARYSFEQKLERWNSIRKLLEEQG